MLKAEEVKRYQRQISLPELGMAGQEQLAKARVLVVGAGGLGCPVLQYLAGAGVGTLGIIDDDLVSLSNLHRQIIYTVDDIGSSKAAAAGKYLSRLNPTIEINVYSERLIYANALEIFSGYDILVDATDNFPTRYLINDACVLLNLPLVYGAVSRFEGQVAVFNVTDAVGCKTSYRDLFPVSPKAGEILNCEEAGVLGVLPGIIGVMQANEVIKMITGIGQPLTNQLLTYDARTCQIYTIALKQSEGSIAYSPKTIAEFRNTDDAQRCGVTASARGLDIDGSEFFRLVEEEAVAVIDVREHHELPELEGERVFRMPLSTFKGLDGLDFATFVFVCQSGARSRALVGRLIAELDGSVQLYNLAGGVKALLR